jgi:hypothetical protein
MMTFYRGLLGIVELYRFIRSIRGILKLRGGIGKLLPPDFDQLRRCAAHGLPRMMNHDELSGDPRRDDPVRSQRSVNQLPAHGDAGQNRLYLAAQRLEDDRWRYQSPSRFARFYGNLGWKDADAEVHLVASEADNFFGMIGPNQA